MSRKNPAFYIGTPSAHTFRPSSISTKVLTRQKSRSTFDEEDLCNWLNWIPCRIDTHSIFYFYFMEKQKQKLSLVWFKLNWRNKRTEPCFGQLTVIVSLLLFLKNHQTLMKRKKKQSILLIKEILIIIINDNENN